MCEESFSVTSKQPSQLDKITRVSSEIFVLVNWELHTCGIFELFVHVLDLILIDGDLRWLENGGLDEGEVGVTIHKNSLVSI